MGDPPGRPSRPGLGGAEAYRSDPRFADMLRAFDGLPAQHDAGSFRRACSLAATVLPLVTVVAIATHQHRQRMFEWCAAGVAPHQRDSSSARAWSSLTLGTIDTAHDSIPAMLLTPPRYLKVSLPAIDVLSAWFVQYEGEVAFDPVSVEVLHHLAFRLREVCDDLSAERAPR